MQTWRRLPAQSSSHVASTAPTMVSPGALFRRMVMQHCNCIPNKWRTCLGRASTQTRRTQGFTPALANLRGQASLAGVIGIQPTSDAPSPLLVLGVALGLPMALWAYKCLMMFVFQRRIIYMGYVPMGSRKEKLRDVNLSVLKGISCDEVRIPSEKGVELSGLVISRHNSISPEHVMIYLQGNAGSPLHRLPVFATLIHAIGSLSIVSAAPRSYWTSSSARPTQTGITADYTHVLQYATSRYSGAILTVYGHSLGGAAAVCILSQLQAADYPSVGGLILENPFASIPAMVHALYPQRWLPYHYMGPLVWDQWDAARAIDNLAQGSVLHGLLPDMLVMVSERDEMVPVTMGRELYARSVGKGADDDGRKRLVQIDGALHDDAWRQRQWVKEIASYLKDVHARRQQPPIAQTLSP